MHSLLCTNVLRCGLGPVVGSDLALAPGAWSAGHWGPLEREHLVRRGHYTATCVLSAMNIHSCQETGEQLKDLTDRALLFQFVCL